MNLEAVYPDRDNPSHEMSFEELRAATRGWLNKQWKPQKSQKPLKEIPHNVICKEPLMDKQEESVDKKLSAQTQETLVIEEKVHPAGDSVETTEVYRDGKSGKARRLKVREIKGETQTSKSHLSMVNSSCKILTRAPVKTNLESPTKPKIKRKNSSEPTMTLHTRAATDEIYSIFNQPLKSETNGDAESVCESEFEDDDYTSAGESTETGRVSVTTSEFGEEETASFKKTHENDEAECFDEENGNVSGAESVAESEWSDFSASKHIPKVGNNTEDRPGQHNLSHHHMEESEESMASDSHRKHHQLPSDLMTPTAEEMEENLLKEKYNLAPPEDYDPPSGPYRDASVVALNKLPFMTPIVEQTESSLAPSTEYARQFLNPKTPSKNVNTSASTPPSIPKVENLLLSSPFQEFTAAHDGHFGVIHGDGSPVRSSKKLKPSPKKLSPKKTTEPLPEPIIKDAQCNPVDGNIRSTILKNCNPPLSTYVGYHDHSGDVGMHSAEIQKYAKNTAKQIKEKKDRSSDRTFAIPPILCFTGAERSYAIKREIGKGAFAPVYLVESVDSPDTFTSDSETDTITKENNKRNSAHLVDKKPQRNADRQSLEAIKMETDPPSCWEFYILRTAHHRLEKSVDHARAMESVVRAHEMHLYKNEGFLVEDYKSQGTLLDLINGVKGEMGAANGNVEQGLDEVVAMFFTVELFRTVEALHRCGIQHGDLKADNCLVRFEDSSPAGTVPSSIVYDGNEMDPLANCYSPSGFYGWHNKGLTLIDFGRGIDMQAFRPDVSFIADWKAGSHECPEMREMRTWTYQLDLYGLAGIIHVLLFGKYLEHITIPAPENGGLGVGGAKTYRIKESLKRYWERDIWGDVFDLCLNPTAERWARVERMNNPASAPPKMGELTPKPLQARATEATENGTTMPPVNSMKEIRGRMEDWLVANSERKGLKSSIRKLNAMVTKKREKSL